MVALHGPERMLTLCFVLSHVFVMCVCVCVCWCGAVRRLALEAPRPTQDLLEAEEWMFIDALGACAHMQTQHFCIAHLNF